MLKTIIELCQVTVNVHEIIEDQSPYYIRFTHEGIDDLLTYCHNHIPDLSNITVFQHYIFPWEQSQKILSLVPAAEVIPFQKDRVSLFITAPGYAYTAHKELFLQGQNCHLMIPTSIVPRLQRTKIQYS